MNWSRKVAGFKFGAKECYHAPRILMYHMVAERLPQRLYSDGKKVKNFLRVEPQVFEQQVEWLKANGFSFYKMSDVLRNDLPERSVFLTFDDGFADNFLNAFPVLKKHNIPATIYLVVNRFSRDWATDRVSGVVSTELNDQYMLEHDQVKEMIGSGLVEFGGHTVDHVRLDELEDQDALSQLVDSKQQIEVLYGIECVSFAYPFGFYRERSIDLVREAGYHNACTTEDGTDSDRLGRRFRLRRVMVSGNDNMRKFIRKMRNGGGR